MNKFIWSLFFLLVIIIFSPWFNIFPLSSGDWSYHFPRTIEQFEAFPYVWSTRGIAGGMGGNISYILGLETYFLCSNVILNQFQIPWSIAEKLIAFWPFLIFSCFSPYFLFKKIFPELKYPIIASYIFLFNSYILLMVAGGQMGIAIAYSISPLVLYAFLNLANNSFTKRNLFFYSVFLSLLIFFDLRIAYTVLLSVFLYWLIIQIEIKTFNHHLKSFTLLLVAPIFIAFTIQSFWVLPLVIGQQNPIIELGPAYSSVESVKFFSFAKLENTIGFLHPNWPENIFGKVFFMRPEFLFLPILAYSSLFFIKNLKRRERILIVYFALLGLIGSFLAKGSNDPLGGIYLWLFENIPGFIMFRDPTKWFILIALSYSILITFTLNKISNKK